MKRVYVVDDDPTIHAILQLALGHQGWALTSFHSGVGLSERAALESPDLILLDSIMPEMSGLDVLSELRSGCPSIPVVILTAESDDATRERFITAGAKHVLHKPVAPLEVGRKLNELMGWS